MRSFAGAMRSAAAIAGALLALGLLALAPRPARAADDALVEAARKEGQVVWYTTLIVNQVVRPLQEAFEKKYPGVKLQYSRADDAPTALKILSETRAGRLQADIIDSLFRSRCNAAASSRPTSRRTSRRIRPT
jgi:ABC-type glycerol-3-phosphate transport system substrate-binding protein